MVTVDKQKPVQSFWVGKFDRRIQLKGWLKLAAVKDYRSLGDFHVA